MMLIVAAAICAAVAALLILWTTMKPKPKTDTQKASEVSEVSASEAVSETASETTQPRRTEGQRIAFYNRMSDSANRYNFGPSGPTETAEAAMDELVDRLTDSGSGDKKLPDPCLAVAIAASLGMERLESAHLNELAKRLAVDPSMRLQYTTELKGILQQAEPSVEPIGSYTSMMYMNPGEPPELIIKPSKNEGGTALVLKCQDGKVVRLRINCGYQPLDIEWEPSTPPTTPTAPTVPTVPTTPTVPLEPKDAAQAVPVQEDPNNAPAALVPAPEARKDYEPTEWVPKPAEDPIPSKDINLSVEPVEPVELEPEPSLEPEVWRPQKDVAAGMPSDSPFAGEPINTGLVEIDW